MTFAGQTIHQGLGRRDIRHLIVNDREDTLIAHGAGTKRPPAVNVQLLEIRIRKETAIPQSVRTMHQRCGGAPRYIIGAPVIIPGWSHAQFAIIAFPGKHTDEHAVPVLGEHIENEVIHKVQIIQVATISQGRIPPHGMVVEHIFKVHEPVFNGVSLGRVDHVTIGVVEIEEAIALSRDIVCPAR